MLVMGLVVMVLTIIILVSMCSAGGGGQHPEYTVEYAKKTIDDDQSNFDTGKALDGVNISFEDK